MEPTQINTAFPLWLFVLSFVSILGTGIWALITMFFKSKNMDIKIDELIKDSKNDMDNLRLDFKQHKEETRKDIESLYKKLDNMNNTLIETNTYCKILLGDKMKK